MSDYTEPMFWGGNNCICPEGIAQTGYQPHDSPAAEHENYFRRQTYLCIKELQSYLFNIADPVSFLKDESTGLLYYLDEAGNPLTDAVKINGIPYLFAPDGALRVNFQNVFGKRYYYDPTNGNMVLGWVSYLDALYYVTLLEGKLVNQYRTIDGKNYYFDSHGIATELSNDTAETSAT